MSDWLARTQELAEAGRTAYQIQLGHSYLIGRDFEGNAIPKNYGKAREWLERAHGKGAATATYLLGTIYENGFGVPKNLTVAIEYYSTSAGRGSYQACLSLARVYMREDGLSSRENAAKWYGQALRFEDEVDDITGINEARAFLEHIRK